MTDPDYIDGEVERRDQLPERRQALPAEQRQAPPATFNPLDADPERFKLEVEKRQANYDALREYLLSKMVRGHDYGPVHVIKDCPDKYRNCQNPAHYSADTLFDAGADTVLTLLGLGVDYDGEDGYRQATLRGVQIQDVMITATIVTHTGQVLAKATGSASVKEHQQSLHNTLQKAHKRARVNAVRALPTVKSLFKNLDTAITGDDMARRPPPRQDQGPEPQRNAYDTGRQLETMPFGKHKGVPFTQLDGRYLEWVLDNVEDKPDVTRAARAELDRRALQEPELPESRPEYARDYASPRSGGVTLPEDDDGFDDDGPPPDAYFR